MFLRKYFRSVQPDMSLRPFWRILLNPQQTHGNNPDADTDPLCRLEPFFEEYNRSQNRHDQQPAVGNREENHAGHHADQEQVQHVDNSHEHPGACGLQERPGSDGEIGRFLLFGKQPGHQIHQNDEEECDRQKAVHFIRMGRGLMQCLDF